MGNKWEVRAWVKPDNGGYTFEAVYDGPSMIKAIFAAIRAKRTVGMVKVEWR